MQTLIAPRHQPVRTVLHLSPTVTMAALVQAQRHDLVLGEWLENLVVQNCAETPDVAAAHRMSDLMSIELFAHIASVCPGAFTGRWKLLFERCLQEDQLWHYPQVTLAEAEAGEDTQPTLNPRALLLRWPELVASVWLAC